MLAPPSPPPLKTHCACSRPCGESAETYITPASRTYSIVVGTGFTICDADTDGIVLCGVRPSRRQASRPANELCPRAGAVLPVPGKTKRNLPGTPPPRAQYADRNNELLSLFLPLPLFPYLTLSLFVYLSLSRSRFLSSLLSPPFPPSLSLSIAHSISLPISPSSLCLFLLSLRAARRPRGWSPRTRSSRLRPPLRTCAGGSRPRTTASPSSQWYSPQ